MLCYVKLMLSVSNVCMSDLKLVCICLQEAMKILNRFGYKNITEQYLVMSDNFRPENCFVIQVCAYKTCVTKLTFHCNFRNKEIVDSILRPQSQ